MRALDDERGDLAARYRSFARVQAAPVSPLYAELAEAVAEDPDVLAFLAALTYLHGGEPPAGAVELHARVTGHAGRLRATMLARATQTNEAARCAGLCLHPDRYAYEYDGGHRVGPESPVLIRCTTTGTGPRPTRVPEVVARVVVDLDPLDPADPDDVAWLDALIWPGDHDRHARLRAAAAVAAREPATRVRGDLVDRLPEVVAALPAGATAVVFHTAVLAYLPRAAVAQFTELVGSLPVTWISQEGASVLPSVTARLPQPPARDEPRFLLARDGEPLAWTRPHGGAIDWLPAAAGLVG